MSVTRRKNGCSNYSIEEWIEAVRRRMYPKTSFAETLAIYDISCATLSNWIKRFKGEVIRHESGKGVPLYVRKYQETMTPEEEKELARLRRENADLKLIQEANELMMELAKERFHIDIKKNYKEMLSGKSVADDSGALEAPQ